MAKEISREDILRMIGLSGAVRGLGASINSLKVDVADIQGDMVTYWTEITQSEEQIQLLAGRVSENESSIATLTVRAEQIALKVESNTQKITTNTNKITGLTTTVEQHTTKIGELEVTDSQIKASVKTVSDTVTTQGTAISGLQSTVGSLGTTVEQHTTKIGELEVTDSQIKASVKTVSDTVTTQGTAISGLQSSVNTHTEQIGQLQVSDTNIRASVSSLSTTVNNISGTVESHSASISSLEITASSITNRVQSLEDSYIDISDVADWEQGGFSTTSSAGTSFPNIKTSSSAYIRTKNPVPITRSTSFTLANYYILGVFYLDSSKNYISHQVGLVRSASTGKVSLSIPSTARYVGLELSYPTGNISTSALANSGLYLIETSIITEAYLSLYVDKASVSWLTGSADNVIFNFNKNFQIQHQGTAVFNLLANGDLEITGELKPNSQIGTLVVDSNGNLTGSGSLVTDNIVAGYKTQEITVPTTNNSKTTINGAQGLFVFLKGSAQTNTHYFLLPTLTNMRTLLNISSTSAFFSARIVLINQSSADHCYISYRDHDYATAEQPWKMSFDNTHYTGGAAVTQLAVGDYIEILLIYNPSVGEYRAFEIVHNN